MTRKTETATRRDWLYCLELLDAKTAAALTAELNTWDGGDTCPLVEFTVNATRHIDGDSSPRPAECEGHPAGPFDAMGETVYCDGTCRSYSRTTR